MLTFKDRSLTKVGVIGSGSIGPDIALYLAKVLAVESVSVVVVDVSQAALTRGEERLRKKVEKGIASGAFSTDLGEAMLRAVTFTPEYRELRGAGMVIEAATENLEIKQKIFLKVQEICGDECIMLSNSSHLTPEEIFDGHKGVRNRNSAVLHWFYPAERNQALELVPGFCDKPIVDWLMKLWEFLGKQPFLVESRYGYVVDAIFEGIGLAACLLVNDGFTPREIDWVQREALGATVGVFTAMNLTNGGPLTLLGLKRYSEEVHPWYHVPEVLQEQVDAKRPWDVAERGESVEVSPEHAATITKALQGAYLCLVAEVLEAKLIAPDELERLLPLALDMMGPFALMQKLGSMEALQLALDYSNDTGAPTPLGLCNVVPLGGDYIPRAVRVERDIGAGICLVTLCTPHKLNALTWDVYRSLERIALEVRSDSSIRGVIITGQGTKAFCAGANVSNLHAVVCNPEEAIRRSRTAQRVGLAIEAIWKESKKPVVFALNGLALGGGLELALCGQVRVATYKSRMGLPEVTLGLFPGAGGTQRLPRLIGFNKASALIRTGTIVSAGEAQELGIISDRASWEDLLTVAHHYAVRLVDEGDEALESMVPPVDTRGAGVRTVPVDLNGLSQAVDQLVCEVMETGIELPIQEALTVESNAWGRLALLDDFRIGTSAFVAQPRRKPEFVHR